MTTPEQAAAMVAAAHQRHDDTRRRAIDALRRLDTIAQPITFAAVAQTAGVSRAWLYRDTDLRREIDRLRLHRPRPTPSRPAAEKATADSLRQQLEAAHLLVTELRAENGQLRDALARNLGQRRAAINATEP
jgi:hypothetical protein